MTRRLASVTCNVNDSLAEAAKLMLDHDCESVLAVREDGKPAGMISERDIIRAAFVHERPLGEILVNAALAEQAA